MPAQDSVQEVVDFVSPQGVPYTILKTTEMDAYDPPAQMSKRREPPTFQSAEPEVMVPKPRRVGAKPKPLKKKGSPRGTAKKKKK